MERRKQSLVYLDTHIVVWLYAGLVEKLSQSTKKTIDDCDLLISHIVRLELQYLYETGRIKVTAHDIIKYLSKAVGLKTSESSFNKIINEALKINWTRDVFDRLIVSESSLEEIGLVTADTIILKNYKYAIWD